MPMIQNVKHTRLIVKREQHVDCLNTYSLLRGFLADAEYTSRCATS